MSMTETPAPTVRTEPVPNLPLLRKVLDHIDAHPEQWDQGSWMTDCGTAFCVAGHAAVMTGHVLNINHRDFTIVDVDGIDGDRHFAQTGEELIATVAMQELGVSSAEATDLFAAFNDRECLQDVAERIAARAGERL